MKKRNPYKNKLTDFITKPFNKTTKEEHKMAKETEEKTITMKESDITRLIETTVSALKKEDKEPGIINNFFYGTKAAVRGIAEFASEKAEKASKATKRERAIAEYLKGKNAEMEDFIKKFKE